MADKDINQIEDQRYKDGLCMRPWTGDDGTQKKCIENGHCGCVAKDKKSPSDPALLPCPFCDSDDIDPSFARGYERGDPTQPTVAAGCNSCGATGPMVRVPDHSTGYNEATTKWNDRFDQKKITMPYEQGNVTGITKTISI